MYTKREFLFTTNLSIFRYHPVNRDHETRKSINRIKRIAHSMITEGLEVCPIVVTTKFYVIDGQHRLEAAKIAGKGIWYFIDEKVANTDKAIFTSARKRNANTKEWSKFDYVKGMVTQGYKDYKILNDFTKKYPMFSFTEQLMLLQNSGTKDVTKTNFTEGKFKVVSLPVAELWGNRLLQIREFFPAGYNKSNFVRTMLTIFENNPDFKFEEFMYKLRLRPTSLKLCGDKRSYSELIEQIYNYNRKKEDRLSIRFL